MIRWSLDDEFRPLSLDHKLGFGRHIFGVLWICSDMHPVDGWAASGIPLAVLVLLGQNNPVGVNFFQWPSWQELVAQHCPEGCFDLQRLDPSHILQLIDKYLIQGNRIAVVFVGLRLFHMF